MTLDHTAKSPMRILVAGTGGTIAATAANAADTVEYSVSASVQDLVAGLGALIPDVAIQTSQIVNVDSSQIGNALLLDIARGAAAALARPDVDALVLTHGTDTLEETAYFLHLVLKTEKPVVMVGAMKPATAIGADGPANLLAALQVARTPEAAGLGVLVLSNGAVFSGRDLTKTHPSALDALATHRLGPLGEVSGADVLFWHHPSLRHTIRSAFDIAQISDLPRVDIFYDHQDCQPDLYASAIKGGAKGLVVAAYGNGSLSPAAEAGARMAKAHGLPFIRASRTAAGIVARRQSDLEQGMISALSLNPQKARILLLCALTKNLQFFEIQQVFASH